MLTHRKLVTAGIVLLISGAFAPVTRADSVPVARKAIQAQYDQANKAASKKDAKGAMAIYTPDFTQKDEKGNTQTLEQAKQLTALLMKAATSISASQTIQTISVKGDTATVHIKQHTKLVVANPQTKKLSTLIEDAVCDDMWVKKGSTWLQKKSVQTSSTATADGKPITEK